MNDALQPRSATELGELLRGATKPMRLRGSGSRQDRLPAAGQALHVDLRGFDAIHRLDAPDLTCSVGAGIDRERLDAELHARGVELACAGGGTLGGLFAADPIGATALGRSAPRSTLLGCEGVLADGTSFRSGACVVKSVAGYDVHKLLIGSQGRLFAATRLHLRLVPRPRAEAWFRRARLDEREAFATFTALRNLAVPPASLHWTRDAEGHAVAGRITGRPGHVAAMLRVHELPEHEPFRTLHLEVPEGGEVVTGIVLPSRVPALLAAVPTTAQFVLHGGGRFEVALPSRAATDGLLAASATVPAPMCIARGEPARRGRGTPLDPGQQRLTDGIKRALDPHGILV